MAHTYGTRSIAHDACIAKHGVGGECVPISIIFVHITHTNMLNVFFLRIVVLLSTVLYVEVRKMRQRFRR